MPHPRFAPRLILVLASGAWLATAAEDDRPVQPALAAPAPKVLITPATLDRIDELTCTKCHAEIVGEWAASAHALSWVDEAYQEELKGRRKQESCHPCHIPAPLHEGDVGERPDARKDAQHFGVSCDSCHLGPGGAMLGPVGAATDAHVSKRSDTLFAPGSNALCSSCHKTTIGPVIGIAKDFETAGKSAKGESCVGCHFARLREVDDGAGGKRVVRSHALQTPRDPSFLARAFEPRVEVGERQTTVVIENRAGHRVPGLIGREIEFRATLLDAGGKEIGKGELVIDTSSYLPVDDAVRIAIDGRAARVRLVGLHTDPRAAQPIEFLTRELSP
jgi:hypothetical protein